MSNKLNEFVFKDEDPEYLEELEMIELGKVEIILSGDVMTLEQLYNRNKTSLVKFALSESEYANRYKKLREKYDDKKDK